MDNANATQEAIPDSVMVRVRHAVITILEARQKIRECRHYARIESRIGRGLVDRPEYLRRVKAAGISVAEIRERRALLRQVAEIATELGIDAKSVLGEVWAEEKASLPPLRFELRLPPGIRWG